MNNFNLENEPKIETGFKTPEGYFDDFSKKMMLEINSNQNQKVILFSERLKNNRKMIFRVAALLLLSVSVFGYLQYNNRFSEIKNHEIESYMVDHNNISEDDLVELLDNETIDKINLESKIENKDIEEHLIQETELDQIIED